MLLNVLIILAFVGILSGLSRLFKQEEIDLDNENKKLVKESERKFFTKEVCMLNYLK